MRPSFLTAYDGAARSPRLHHRQGQDSPRGQREINGRSPGPYALCLLLKARAFSFSRRTNASRCTPMSFFAVTGRHVCVGGGGGGEDPPPEPPGRVTQFSLYIVWTLERVQTSGKIKDLSLESEPPLSRM